MFKNFREFLSDNEEGLSETLFWKPSRAASDFLQVKKHAISSNILFFLQMKKVWI